MHNNNSSSRSRNGRASYDSQQRQGRSNGQYPARARASSARNMHDLQSTSPYPVRNTSPGILGAPPAPSLSLPQHPGLFHPSLATPSMEWLLRQLSLSQPPPTHLLQNQLAHPGFFPGLPPPLNTIMPPYLPPFPFGCPPFPIPTPAAINLLPGCFFNFNEHLLNSHGLQTSPIDMRINASEKAARKSSPRERKEQVEKREPISPKQKPENFMQQQMGKVEVPANDLNVVHGFQRQQDVMRQPEVVAVVKNEAQSSTSNNPAGFLTAPQDKQEALGQLLPGAQGGIPNHKKFQYKSWTDGATASTSSDTANANDANQVVPTGPKIRCVDKDGTIKEVRLSPFISEEDARERICLLGVEEAQREIDAFAALIISGARLLEFEAFKKIEDARAAAERLVKLENRRAEEAESTRDDSASAPGNLQRAAGMQNLHSPLCDGKSCKHGE